MSINKTLLGDDPRSNSIAIRMIIEVFNFWILPFLSEKFEAMAANPRKGTNKAGDTKT